MPLFTSVSPRRGLLAVAALIAFAAGVVGWNGTVSASGVQQQPNLLVALTGGNQLNLIASELPGVVLYSVGISGLGDSNESIVGIDVRPANGKLYGVSSANRLYTIDPFTGVATRAGVGTFNPTLQGMSFGVDFNPVPDRLRVVSNARQNLRLNPDTGAVVDGDPNTAGVQPDGMLTYDANDRNAAATPRIVAAAYTNNVAGATTTTNYAIDSGLDVLVTQGSVNGSPVGPNTGRLFTVGQLGVDTSDIVGFDIAPSGRTFAALNRPGDATSGLYTIDLATGAARLIGTIGGGQPVRGLAVIR